MILLSGIDEHVDDVAEEEPDPEMHEHQVGGLLPMGFVIGLTYVGSAMGAVPPCRFSDPQTGPDVDRARVPTRLGGTPKCRCSCRSFAEPGCESDIKKYHCEAGRPYKTFGLGIGDYAVEYAALPSSRVEVRATGADLTESSWDCLIISAAQPPIRELQRLPTSSTSKRPSWCRRASTNIPARAPGITPRCCSASRSFETAIEQSRWRAYPLGLAMVGEMVEGVLRPHVGRPARCSMRCIDARARRFSTAIRCRRRSANEAWRERAPNCVRRLDQIGMHPPKRAIDIADALCGSLFRHDADPREAAQRATIRTIARLSAR